ncbi:MAG: antibiotic biosynthesis monooxygenase [Acidobacteriota bacterium]
MTLLPILLGAVIAAHAPNLQARGADVPVDATVYAAAYVEVMPSARAAAIAALKQYRDASRRQEGFGRLDLFEQIGWPGHFAIFEAWRDQPAFDAHNAAAQKPLLEALQPIRVSGFDQRPYKTLSVAPPEPRQPAPAGGSISVVSHVDVSQDPRVPVMLRSLAEASRKEDGNLRFDVVQHTMRANHFTIIETWRDQKALDAHTAAAHTRQYRDALQPMTGSPLDERVHRPVE